MELNKWINAFYRTWYIIILSYVSYVITLKTVQRMRDKWNCTLWNMNLNFRHTTLCFFYLPLFFFFWLGLCCANAFLCTAENITQHSRFKSSDFLWGNFLTIAEERSEQGFIKATLALLHFIITILCNIALLDLQQQAVCFIALCVCLGSLPALSLVCWMKR